MDRIEREISIDAPLDRVWDLVAQMGFWVNLEPPVDQPLKPGDEVVKNIAAYGRFPIRVVDVRPKEYVSYRWASAFPDQDLTDDNTTLVEFTLTPHGDATRLTVVESGFARLAAPEERRRKAYDDNTEGWAEELDKLRKLAES